MGIFKNKWEENLKKSIESTSPKKYGGFRGGDVELNKNNQSQGLGDTIKKITSKFGIKPCEGCEKRANKLNDKFPYGNKQIDEGTKLGDRSDMFDSRKYKLTTSIIKKGTKVFVPHPKKNDEYVQGTVKYMKDWHNQQKARYIVDIGERKPIEARPEDTFIMK